MKDAQDPQILFIELGLKLLKSGGILGIVLPEGIFGNKKSGYVWDYIRKYGYVEEMIDCPRTTFQPSTDTKTNVLFVRKNNTLKKSDSVLISVALHSGHDRRGRTKSANGSEVTNDFKILRESFNKKRNNRWKYCQITDPYYLVPRYYHGKNSDEILSLSERLGARLVSFADLVKTKSLIVRKGNEIGADAYGTGDIPFVRTSDIANWEVSLNTTNGVSEELYEKYKNIQDLKPGDILLVVDGRYKIGRTSILQKSNYACIVQSHFLIITTNSTSPLTNYDSFIF